MTFGKRLRNVLGLLSLIALTTAGPALAHHSFAVFDHSRTVTVKGTVTKFQWTNPHAFLSSRSLTTRAASSRSRSS